MKLAAAAPALALSAAAAPARAQLGAPAAANPAHFRFTIGDAKMTVVSDGFFTTPVSGLGVNADPAEVKDFLEAHFLSTSENYSHTNHLVVDLGDARVLVDVGSGNRFLPTAGRLMANLEQAGIDPASITHVVITHAHPDHILGLRDDFDEPILPDAEYIIGADEHAYWMQDGLVDRVDPAAQQFVVGAVNSIKTEGVDWTLAQDGHEVAPGITLMATPGHTPGHMSLRVDSAGESLIALGDAMSHPYTNFAHPDWFNGFDMDGPQTVETRMGLLKSTAADRTAILGYHFPFPGVGHVMELDGGYRYVPALWQFQG